MTAAPTWVDLFYQELIRISGSPAAAESNKTAIDLIYAKLAEISGTAAVTGAQSFKDLIYRKLVEISGTAALSADGKTAQDRIYRKLIEITGAAVPTNRGQTATDLMYLALVGISGGFIAQSDVDQSTVITSNIFTIPPSVSPGTAISISGGTYSIDGAVYTSSSGTVDPGNLVTAHVTSSADPSTAATAAVTIGATVYNFTVTTASPILNTLSVQPVAAWSLGRVLKTGKTAISGTTAALTQVLDQIGTNHLTPSGFTAVVDAGATGIVGQNRVEAGGLPYLFADNTNDYLAVTTDITIGSAFTLAVGVGIKAGTGAALMGKHGNAAPFVKLTATQGQVRGAFSTATATGSWTLTDQFNYVIITYDGATINYYVNASDSSGTPVLWATTTTAGSVGVFNDILSNQSGNFWGGGWGESILFDQALGATDLAKLMKSGELAWRSSYYIDPDAADNTAIGWSAALPKANFDEIGITGTRICKPGFRAKVKRGATNVVSRAHPFFITGSGSTQVGTATKPNIVQSYGTGTAMEIRMSKLAAGAWSLTGGTTYEMAWTQGAERVYWLKAGYTAEAAAAACDTEYANNPPVYETALASLIEFLAPGSAGGEQAAKTAYYDAGASKLYVNIGIDPTGETLEVPDGTTAAAIASGGRGCNISRTWWQWSGVNVSFSGDDNFSLAADDLTVGSLTDLTFSVGGVADILGDRGGNRHTVTLLTGMFAGHGYDADGSAGDFISAHGGTGHYRYRCRNYACGKAGYDDVFGASTTNVECRSSGSPSNFWPSTATENGVATTRIYTDCEGKQTQIVSDLGLEKPMFRCVGDSTHHEATIVQINGGTFRGYDVDSTFVGLDTFSGAQVAVVTTGLTKSNFGHQYSNSSNNGGVLTVDGVAQ